MQLGVEMIQDRRLELGDGLDAFAISERQQDLFERYGVAAVQRRRRQVLVRHPGSALLQEEVDGRWQLDRNLC